MEFFFRFQTDALQKLLRQFGQTLTFDVVNRKSRVDRLATHFQRFGFQRNQQVGFASRTGADADHEFVEILQFGVLETQHRLDLNGQLRQLPQRLFVVGQFHRKHDEIILLGDEVYEHILFDGHRHLSLAALDGMRDRTVTVNSLSKTYSVTGWRVGYILAPKEVTDGIRKVHDFLTVGAPAPLQEAAAVALSLPDEYYRDLAAMYQAKRDLLQGHLQRAEIPFFEPQGAYYVMADISGFGFADDTAFALHVVREHRVATVPGSSFYHVPALGQTQRPARLA